MPEFMDKIRELRKTIRPEALWTKAGNSTKGILFDDVPDVRKWRHVDIRVDDG